jgi:predicted dehydrogenase
VGYYHFAHSYVRGNWRREDETGPSILAKCCHDLDMIYYLTGKKAKTVYSAGYRKAFMPENAPEGAPSHCLSGCPIEKTCPYHVDRIYLTPKRHSFPFFFIRRRLICERPGASRKEFKDKLRTSPYGRCVYKCDNDVMENQVVSLKLEGDIPATLTMTCHTNRVYRHTRISGTKGEIVGEGGKFKLNIFAGPKKTYRFSLLEAIGHASGDRNIIKDFLKLLRTNEIAPKLSLMKDTMESHLVAFAAEESRKTGKIIEMPKY